MASIAEKRLGFSSLLFSSLNWRQPHGTTITSTRAHCSQCMQVASDAQREFVLPPAHAGGVWVGLYACMYGLSLCSIPD